MGKGALIAYAVIGMIVIGLLIVIGVLISKMIKGKEIGDSCKVPFHCTGTNKEKKDQEIRCCQGKCEKPIPDFAGVLQCKHVCRDAPWPLGEAGSCGSGNHWPRHMGEPCNFNTACADYREQDKFKPGSVACCGDQIKDESVCTWLSKDYKGRGQCFDECIGKEPGEDEDPEYGTCPPCNENGCP